MFSFFCSFIFSNTNSNTSFFFLSSADFPPSVTVAPTNRYVDPDMTTFSKSESSGCRVSTAVGFLLTLLAILVAVGVGLIVHFAENDGKQDVVCKCEMSGSGVVVAASGTEAQTGNEAQTGTSAVDMSQECAKLVDQGDESDQICKRLAIIMCSLVVFVFLPPFLIY